MDLSRDDFSSSNSTLAAPSSSTSQMDLSLDNFFSSSSESALVTPALSSPTSAVYDSPSLSPNTPNVVASEMGGEDESDDGEEEQEEDPASRVPDEKELVELGSNTPSTAEDDTDGVVNFSDESTQVSLFFLAPELINQVLQEEGEDADKAVDCYEDNNKNLVYRPHPRSKLSNHIPIWFVDHAQEEKLILFAGFNGMSAGGAIHSLLVNMFGFGLKAVRFPEFYNLVKAVGVKDPVIRYIFTKSFVNKDRMILLTKTNNFNSTLRFSTSESFESVYGAAVHGTCI